jgi:hypothetical protein
MKQHKLGNVGVTVDSVKLTFSCNTGKCKAKFHVSSGGEDRDSDEDGGRYGRYRY